jgi:hypothetical protein
MSLADAIIAKNIEAVSYILQTGVDINELDEYGFTYLIEAAIANDYEIAKLLIEYGANVNLQDMTGGTPLHWAVENNNIKLCELLLKQRANPNAYTFSGQPLLVMPLLRRQTPLKKLLLKQGADIHFARDFINTKLLGHMFELVGTASLVDTQNNFVEIDFEGFFLEFSVGVIYNSLMEFSNHFGARKLRRFNEVTQIIIASLAHAAELVKYLQYQTDLRSERAKINALIRQEPLIIPVGYEGHAITFIKLGDILVKCDRREESRLYDNIVFYHVNNARLFSTDFIRDFMYEKKSDQFVNEDLPAFLDLKPLTELKIEAQISGNCSWANVEATIPAIFFLLLLASSNNNQDVMKYKTQALHYFHQWREWNKDRALKFCIKSFNEHDTIRNVCKAEILAAVLFQRCRLANIADHERIESILSILTKPQFRHVLDNYIQIYSYASFGQEGKDFAQMLKRFGYP